jgi:CRP/FNR family cyclic AMP-dependent transcriptional regulator
VIKKKMSKQDMAKMIGASREMVSKVMRDLELSGYIRIENDLTVIPGA